MGIDTIVIAILLVWVTWLEFRVRLLTRDVVALQWRVERGKL
jgi:hypothetical protein